MDYYLEKSTEYAGWLLSSNDDSVVEVKYLKFDASSTKILAETLQSRKVSKGKQNLFIEEILINKGQLENFTVGQSALKKTSAGCVLSADRPQNKVRFKAVLNTKVLGEDGNYYKCQADIGSIEFNLEKATKTSGDGVVSFSDVSAVIYPFGEYKAIIDDEE